jgi:hypothetical protein
LLNPGGIDAKANGVDLRSRFNQPLDCPANSFAVLRNVIEKLDFHVARKYVQRNTFVQDFKERETNTTTPKVFPFSIPMLLESFIT